MEKKKNEFLLNQKGQKEGLTFVIDEAMQKARFARSCITDNDEFEEVIVSFRHSPFLRVTLER